MKIGVLPPQKLPERLIYTHGEMSKIFSTRTGDILGHIKTKKMLLKDDSYYPNGAGNESLYIKDLEVRPFCRRQGIGSELVKFAKKLSIQLGAEGRVHLIAYNHKKPSDSPHKFYRKLGFYATSADENRDIDFAIENDIPIPPLYTQGTPMYLKQF